MNILGSLVEGSLQILKLDKNAYALSYILKDSDETILLQGFTLEGLFNFAKQIKRFCKEEKEGGDA